MALFTVEKQIVYLEADKREVPHPTGSSYEQEHLSIRTRRVPWRNSPAQRVMGFIEAGQFGELESPGSIRNFDQLRSVLFGKTGDIKLIVADIPSSGGHIKQDLLVKLMTQFNIKNKVHYRPHYGSWKEINSIWFMVDPTRPGRVTVPLGSGIKIARGVFSGRMTIARSAKGFLQEDYKSMLADYMDEPEPERRRSRKTRIRHHKEHKKKYQNSVLYLGTVFVVRFWPTRVPVELYWSEGIQRRVRAHLTQERTLTIGVGTKHSHPIDIRGTMEWYVMGSTAAPKKSERTRQTPRGRYKEFLTYKPGVGFVDLATNKRHDLKPIFIVRGRNADAARAAAQKRFDQMIENPATADKGYALEEKWMASGQKVISRAALRKYRER